jgi:multiple sugar transport system substrate-binding protein
MSSAKRSSLQIFVGGVLFLFVLFDLTGCSQPVPPPEPVTITFGYVGFDNRTSERQYYQDLADQFHQEYPNITVEVGFSSLYSAFYGDELGKDMMLIPDFIFSALIDEELIIPLDGFIQQDPDFPYDDYYEGMLDIYTLEGQSWAIPASVDPYVFYYNKDLFDQAGVPYPGLDWTWDDFLSAALDLRDPGAGIFGYGPTIIFGPDSDYLESIVFIYQHGGEILDDFKEPTTFVFDDPAAIEALNWYSNLFNLHDVAPTEEQELESFGDYQSQNIYQGIGLERIAIWSGLLSESRGQSYLIAPWDFAVGVLPPPGDQQPFSLVFSSAYVMAAETEHPEEAWQWIEFLSGQVGYGAFPVRRSVIESKAFEDQVGAEIADVLKLVLEDARYFPTELGDEIGRDFGSFQRALDKMVNQGMAPEEAMDWASER